MKGVAVLAGVGVAVLLLIYGDEYPLVLEKVVALTGFEAPARLIAGKYVGPMYCTCRTSDDYARVALAQLARDRPDVVVALMRDPNLTVSYSAISISGRSRATAYVPELMRHYQSRDPYERILALYSLASIGDARAKPIFKRAFEEGENDEVRAVGGAGLVVLGEKGYGSRLSDLSDRALNALSLRGPNMASHEFDASSLAAVASLASDDSSFRGHVLDKLQRDMMLLRLQRCIGASKALRRHRSAAE